MSSISCCVVVTRLFFSSSSTTSDWCQYVRWNGYRRSIKFNCKICSIIERNKFENKHTNNTITNQAQHSQHKGVRRGDSEEKRRETLINVCDGWKFYNFPTLKRVVYYYYFLLSQQYQTADLHTHLDSVCVPGVTPTLHLPQLQWTPNRVSLLT